MFVVVGARGNPGLSSIGGVGSGLVEEELGAAMISPYNPGGVVMRKRSGTSHAQKQPFKNNSGYQYTEENSGINGHSPTHYQVGDKE